MRVDAPPINHVQIIDGKAYILSNGRRLKAKIVAAMVVKAGATVEETMEYHELSRAEVYSALAYYYDNQEAIEQSFREADEYVRQYGISTEELKARMRARREQKDDE